MLVIIDLLIGTAVALAAALLTIAMYGL